MSISNSYESYDDGNWNLTINTNDYSDKYEYIEFEDGVNTPVTWNAKLQGVDSSNSDISEKNNVKVDYNGNKAFKGKIAEKNPSSDVMVNLEGTGMSYELGRIIYSKNYSGSDFGTVASDIMSQSSSIGLTNNVSASPIDFRMQDESLINGINRLCGDHGAEWILRENNGSDEVLIENEIGGGSPVGTIKESNAVSIDRNDNATDGAYDGVKVKGYGDGDDQVTATAGATGSDNAVFVHVDKTIISTSEAQDKANELKKLAVDNDWTEITAQLADPNQVRNIGDVLTVRSRESGISQSFSIVGVDAGGNVFSVSGDQTSIFTSGDEIIVDESTGNDGEYEVTGVSYDSNNDETDLTVSENVSDSTADGDIIRGIDYRVVKRFYKVNLGGSVEAELILNNKPTTFYNRIQETKSETESQTKKMQGSRNVWGDKEVGNCSNNEPLTVDFYLPKDVVDEMGNNRTSKVKLDYSAAEFKQGAGSTSAKTTDTAPGSTTGNNKVYSVNPSSTGNGKVYGVTDSRSDTTSDVPSNSVSIKKSDINEESHSVASADTNTEDADDVNEADIDSFTFNESLDSSGWDQLDNGSGTNSLSITGDGLFHLVVLQFEISSSTNMDIAIVQDSTVIRHISPQEVGTQDSFSITNQTGQNHFRRAFYVPVNPFDTGSYTYECHISTKGGGSPTVDGRFQALVRNHSHSVPTTADGVNVLDSGTNERITFETDAENNFESSAVNETTAKRVENTSTDSESTTDSVGQSDEATIDDTDQTREDRVKTIGDDVSRSTFADDVAIIVDGTNIDGSNNTHDSGNVGSGNPTQDSEIDITSFLDDNDGDGKPDVGWHTIKIRPESTNGNTLISFMKARVFAEHHKDSNTA